MRARLLPIRFLLVVVLLGLLAALPWGLGAALAEVRNPDGVAVIVGNRDYTHPDVPDVSFAHRDADAFRRYVVDVLGFDPENILDLRDARQSEMEAAFGNERSHEGVLWRYLNPDGGAAVVVFYSGHGVPGLKDGRGYLLPADANPNTAEINGYPIDLLYGNLAKLGEAASVWVFLDACFSGSSHRGMLVRAASPASVTPSLPAGVAERVTLLTAASGDQVASWDEEAGHGLFTHHLLDALYGAGDGDGDGHVTAQEAKAYLDRHMTRAARRIFGRHQRADLREAGDVVLATASADGAFPARPSLAPTDAPDETMVSDATTDLRVAVVELDELRWTLKTSNVRSGPGTSHEKIGRLTPGTEVNVTGEVEGTNWVRIVWQGRHAYVHESLLGVENPQNAVEKKPVVEQQSANEDISSPQSAPQAPKSYQLVPLNKTMVAKQRTYMRRDPNLSAAIVGSVEANQKIDVLARTDGWYQVTKGTEIGYVTRDTLRDLQCRTVKKTRKGEPVIWDMLDGSWYTGRDGRIYEYADSSHECIRDIMREIDFACSGHVDESRIQFKTKYVGDILPSAYKCEVVSTSIDCVITPQIEYEEQVCD